MQSKYSWEDHIKRWRESGLSKIEYCRVNNINKYTFYEKSREHPGKKRSFVKLSPEAIRAESAPLFEFHITYPFSLKLTINILAGRRT